MNRPQITILVGLPASGKSTFCAAHSAPCDVILSTDNYVERLAREQGTTYDALWAAHIGEAEADLFEQLQRALAERQDIVIDRTNLTAKSRRRILSQVPKLYARVAVVFDVSEADQAARLTQRPGKTIPAAAIVSMRESFEPPTVFEGFDAIVTPRFITEIAA